MCPLDLVSDPVNSNCVGSSNEIFLEQSSVDSDSSMQKEPEESTNPVVQSVNVINLSPEPLWEIPVIYASESIKALVDTGASVSLIKQCYIGSVLDIGNSSDSVVGLGGVKIQPLGKVKLQLLIGNVNLKCDFLVVPDDSLKHSVILGNNFFISNCITLDLKNRKMTGKIESGEFVVQQAGDGDVYTLFRNVPVYSKAQTYVSVDPSLVELSIPEQVQPGEETTLYHFFPMVGNRAFVRAEEGIFPSSESVPKVLVSKLSGRHKKERINNGVLVGYISTVVESGFSEVEINSLQTQPASDFNFDDYMSSLKLEELTCGERERVEQVIKENVAVFGLNSLDIGCASHTKHKIELLKDEPIRQKPRRFPAPVADELERQCEELRQMNVIKYSKSPWSAPIVPIRKSDGTLRMCIDYRQLNKVTKADSFPIPHLTDLVFGLHGMKYFSSIDLMKGYYQVELHKDCTEYTAFSTSQNHYEFLRLPFGLKNAPSAFQREMQAMLKSFNRNQVVVYIDDILIMAPTFEEHLQLVNQVFQTLLLHNVKVNARKCAFFQPEVKFLGHVVGRSGLKKSQEYVEVVKDFPKPKNVNELRSFLGLVNFQRKFIPHCSAISKPLTKVTGGHKKTEILWTVEMEEAFSKLKELVAQEIELAYPDYTSEHKLQLCTDASGYGAGAVLTQVQGDETRVICYVSMTFSQAQRNYSTIERELAAIRWAIHKLRGFLFGVPFILYTDHRPLVYMSNMSNHNTRIMRTLTELSEFDFEVRYKPGPENIAADILSRLGSSSDRQSVKDESLNSLNGLEPLELVPGGGDSLVQSLVYCFKQYKEFCYPDADLPTDMLVVRNTLIDEILNHPERYSLSLSKAKKTKLKLMRLPGQVIPESFLLAVSFCYGLEIWVHHEMGQPMVYTLSWESLPRIHLQCHGGVHYNPLKETQSFSASCYNPLEFGDSTFWQTDSVIDSAEACADINAVVDQSIVECHCSHENSGNTMTVTCFGGRSWCTLVDTGAQVSLISKQVYHYLLRSGSVLTHRSGGVEIVGLGRVIPALGVVEALFRFSGNSSELVNVFAIVQDDLMPYCVILGADFVMKYSAVICFDTKSLIYGCDGQDLKVMLRVNSDTSPCLPEFCCVQNAVISEDGNLVAPSLLLLTAGQCNEAQCNDKVMIKLRKLVLEKTPKEEWPNYKSIVEFVPYKSKMRIVDDLLWYERSIGSLIVVLPFRLFVEVALQVHWKMGHIGRNKLQHCLQREVWHPSFTRVIEDICVSCPVCQKFKVSSNVVAPPVLKIDSGSPFSLLAVDLLLLPQTSRGYIGCLMTIDHSSKWLSCVPIRNKQAQTVSIAFESGVLSGLPAMPARVLSDNGKEFASSIFNELLDKYNIEHIYSTPYKPSSNGAVERVNRTVIERLRCKCSSSDSWDLELPKVVVDYNNSWHSALGMSPSKYILTLAHGHQKPPLVDTSTRESWQLGHPSFRSFTVGMKVLRRVPLQGNSVYNKFMPRFDGPYIIRSVGRSGVTYEVSLDSSEDPRILKVHHTQLKKFVLAPSYLRKHVTFVSLNSSEVTSCHLDEDSFVGDCDVERPRVTFNDNVISSSDSDSGSESCSFKGFTNLNSACLPSCLRRPSFIESSDSESVDENVESFSGFNNFQEQVFQSAPVNKRKSVSFNDCVEVISVPVSPRDSSSGFSGFSEGTVVDTLPGSCDVATSVGSYQLTPQCHSSPVTSALPPIATPIPTPLSPVVPCDMRDYFWDEYEVMQTQAILNEVIDSLDQQVSRIQDYYCMAADVSLRSEAENVGQVVSETSHGLANHSVTSSSVNLGHSGASMEAHTGYEAEAFYKELCDRYPGTPDASGSLSFFEGLGRLFPDTPDTVRESSLFKGFSMNREQVLSKTRLGSLQNTLQDCKGSLNELRRRRRARLHQRYRKLDILDLSNDSAGASPFLGPVTRSRGKVANYPHVQPRILERKT